MVWSPQESLLVVSCYLRSVMTSCRSVSLCVLLLLTITPGSESEFITVKAKLHDSAVLPCSGTCSGVARWTVSHIRSDPLAECDQTSCRSVKEGYQMIYNQYLQGDLSLIITEVDFSKRNWYSCECDTTDFCDVRLQIEALNSTVEIRPGEPLLLELEVSDPVEVIYSSTGAAGASSDQICTVDRGSLQSKPEYSERTSLTPAVVLRDMKGSDSGVYTVRDPRNQEDIHIYTVTVTDVQQSRLWKEGYKVGYSAGHEVGYGAGYQKGLGVGGGSFGIVMLAVGVVLGVFVGPQLRQLMDRNGQRQRNRSRTKSEEEEAGTSMTPTERQEEE